MKLRQLQWQVGSNFKFEHCYTIIIFIQNCIFQTLHHFYFQLILHIIVPSRRKKKMSHADPQIRIVLLRITLRTTFKQVLGSCMLTQPACSPLMASASLTHGTTLSSMMRHREECLSWQKHFMHPLWNLTTTSQKRHWVLKSMLQFPKVIWLRENPALHAMQSFLNG